MDTHVITTYAHRWGSAVWLTELYKMIGLTDLLTGPNIFLALERPYHTPKHEYSKSPAWSLQSASNKEPKLEKLQLTPYMYRVHAPSIQN